MQTRFDARFARWQASETGILVRSWIDDSEMNLGELDLALAEPLEELDRELHAGVFRNAPATPKELDVAVRDCT